jgi:rSAM/selenodomain-associated transferase 1
MAKYPSRLGYEEATKLYSCFLKDTVDIIRRLGAPFFIYFTPDDRKVDFIQLLGDELEYVPQRGSDLGDRLLNGFKASSQMGYPAAIALASDVPDLPVSILKEAVDKLSDFDSVLGPSPDGGYYLIGLRSQIVSGEVFHGIQWSSETVYSETVRLIEERGTSLYSLESWDDVDKVSDLTRLTDSIDPEFRLTRTWKYLEKIYT